MNYHELFKNLPDSSRVWIYQNQSKISAEDQKKIQEKLSTFVSTWAAHEVPLYGESAILEDYFIVLAVDETKTIASGCSIDTSVHFIKELETEFQLSLFDRLNILIEEVGERKIIPYSELSKHRNATFFDPSITKLGEFRQNWKRIITDEK